MLIDETQTGNICTLCRRLPVMEADSEWQDASDQNLMTNEIKQEGSERK